MPLKLVKRSVALVVERTVSAMSREPAGASSCESTGAAAREPAGPSSRESAGASSCESTGTASRERSLELLVVQRPPDDEDLPDAWGLPAGSLREGEEWEEAVRRAGRDKLGVEVRVGPLLKEGETERSDYRLRMRLYAAEIQSGAPSVPQPAQGVTQYVTWDWAGPERLVAGAHRGSLCSRLCLAWLAGSD